MKKGYLVQFYLIIFIMFLSLYDINLNILKQKQIELSQRDVLNDFSLIESEVLIQTIDKFYRYKMEDFIVESSYGLVYITYLDEIAYIKFDFEKPVFGHISLILGKDRTKMSKRHGATSVDQYRKLGYCPKGIVNFLALLGWAPNSEQEIFTAEELVQAFSMDHVAKNPAVFDLDKLNWINQHYMRQLDDEAFFEAAKPQMIEKGVNQSNGPPLYKRLLACRPCIKAPNISP